MDLIMTASTSQADQSLKKRFDGYHLTELINKVKDYQEFKNDIKEMNDGTYCASCRKVIPKKDASKHDLNGDGNNGD